MEFNISLAKFIENRIYNLNLFVLWFASTWKQDGKVYVIEDFISENT